MKRFTSFVAIILSPLALAACDGDADEGSRSPTSSPISSAVDDGLAATMLLDASDFPEGWIHRPYDEKAIDEWRSNPAWAQCFNPSLPGETDRAFGGEYSDKNTTLLSINPAVYVFDSAAGAESGMKSLIDEYDCFAGVVGTGLDVDAGFAYGDTSVETLDADVYDATSAIRFMNTQIYKTQASPNSDVLVFDIIYLTEDRVVYEVTGFQRYAPIDQGLLSAYVEKARLKIRQQP